MATVSSATSIFQELADLFASCPTREEILKFHPSRVLQQHASALLRKQREGLGLSDEEQRELDEFTQAELFMRLVKAKLHVRKAP